MKFINYIIENWGIIAPLLIAILWALIRLIPSEKADKILRFIITILELIPDSKKGGGKHKILK